MIGKNALVSSRIKMKKGIVGNTKAYSFEIYDYLGLAAFYLIYAFFFLLGIDSNYLLILLVILLSSFILCSMTFMLMVIDAVLGLNLTGKYSVFDKFFSKWGYIVLREFMKWIVIYFVGVLASEYINYSFMDFVDNSIFSTAIYLIITYLRLPELMIKAIKPLGGESFDYRWKISGG